MPPHPPPGLTRFVDRDYEGAEPWLQADLAACGGNRVCKQTAMLELGISQLALEELPAAEESLRQALSLAQESRAVAASSLAQVLLETHHYAQAVEQAEFADHLARQQGLLALCADAEGTMAMAMAGLGNIGGGRAQLRDAEKISASLGPAERDRAALRLLSIRAAILRRTGDCPEAEPLLHKILDTTPGQAGDRISLDAHLGLARCARHAHHPATEREHLEQARNLMQQQEQSLHGKTLAAWRRQVLPLQAALREAEGVTGNQIRADETYAFALLYDGDGDLRAALCAAARVNATGPDGSGANALSESLRHRVQIVGQEHSVFLWPTAKETADTARRKKPLRAGTWVEILPHMGGWRPGDWRPVQTDQGPGWLNPKEAGGLRDIQAATDCR